MTNISTPRLLTVREAADELPLGVGAVYCHRAAGRIPAWGLACRAASPIRIEVEALERLMRPVNIRPRRGVGHRYAQLPRCSRSTSPVPRSTLRWPREAKARLQLGTGPVRFRRVRRRLLHDRAGTV